MAHMETIVCFAILAITSASYSGSNYGSQGNYGSSGNGYGGNQYNNVGNNDQYRDGLYFNPGTSYVQAYGGSSSYNVPSYPTSSSYSSRYTGYNQPSYSAPASSSYGSGSSSYGSGSSYSAPAASSYGSGSSYSAPAASSYGSGSSSYGSGSSSYGSGSSYGSSYSNNNDYSLGSYPCGPKDDGKTYAIVGLCYGYYECYYGEALYRQCNNYYSFDAYSGKCVADNSCYYVAPAVVYDNSNYNNNGYAASSNYNNNNNNGYAASSNYNNNNNNGYAASNNYNNNAYDAKANSGY